MTALALALTASCSNGEDQTTPVTEPQQAPTSVPNEGRAVGSEPLDELDEASATTVPVVAPIGLKPVTATRIGAPPRRFYDVSPDGNWISTQPDSETICLDQIGGDAMAVCASTPGTNPEVVMWAPDSSGVIALPNSLGDREIGPIFFAGVDGSTANLATPLDVEGRTDVALHAFFTDDALVYTTLGSGEPRPLQFWSIDLDGSDRELLNEFRPEPGEALLIPDPFLVHSAGVVYAEFNVDPRDVRTEALDLGDGTRTVVFRRDGRDSLPSSASPNDAAGGRLLVFDNRRFLDFRRNSRQGQFWYLIDGDRVVSIPDRGFYRSADASFSPSGSHLAILEVYQGTDPEGNDNPDLPDGPNDLQRTRVSITTTQSIIDGDPIWFDLSGFPAIGRSGDNDGGPTNLIWTNPERLILEEFDGVFEIAIERAE